MSGIAGVVRLDGGAVTAEQLQAMLAPMRRRGPDRRELACFGAAGFAQALLATTPEALAEVQPWRHPHSGCVVVSDSRLDHRPQLLRELGIDRQADEVGDGELLHAAWQRWGEGCAERLRGDFAFAVWHPAEHELYLARDPMGVRPLLFHHAPGRRLVFGSCTEAVLAQGEVPADIDEGRIADALIGETEGIDQDCTFYTAIERLPAAHWLHLREGRLTRRRYWQPVADQRPAGLPASDEEWIEAQREQLDRAVRLRLRSHRPVGSMLSGGLDSSSAVALAARAREQQGGEHFPVYAAIDSGNPDCSETHHIRAVLAHARCAPQLLDLPQFAAQAPGPAWWDEGIEPFDASMTLVAELYRRAGEQGTVSLLDGIPADNLYVIGRQAQQLLRSGQWRAAWDAALAQNRLHLGPSRRPQLAAMKVMVGALAPQAIHALRQWHQDQAIYRQFLQASPIAPELARRAQLWPRFRRYSASIGGSHQWHASGQALSSMAAPYISAGIERYNRVASLFGVEPRPPFADRELIQFQAWMPIDLRLRDGHLKWVLRQAMADLLPDPVRWRTDKQHIGFRFSQVQGQRHRPTATELEPLLARGWLDPARIHAALAYGRTDVADAAHVAAGDLAAAGALARWWRSQPAPAAPRTPGIVVVTSRL